MLVVKNLKKVFKRTSKDLANLKSKNKKNKVKQQVDKYALAVKNLSFSANEGEIFGLIGANGAGKTTSMRCISSLYKPTEGSIEIEGVDIVENPDYAREHITFLTTELKLDKHFSPDYNLTYYGRLRGMSEEEINKRKDYLCDLFEIQSFRYKKVGELSTGMLQKTSIAVSIIHDPKVIIFDEPTNGLDVITARKVTDFLYSEKANGKIVIISTHIMDLAEKLCDKYAVIIDGTLAVEGTLEEILLHTDEKNLEDAFFQLYYANEKAKHQEEEAC